MNFIKNLIMATTLFFLLLPGIEAGERIKMNKYMGQRSSLTDWDKIDLNGWLRFDYWKKEQNLKEKYPEWERKLRERNVIEKVGKVLQCEGSCLLYQGEFAHNATFRRYVYEGDEVHTLKDSYLWVFLLDGTMVRLSPNSSIVFKELNTSPEENFIHARVNSGNILWLSRGKEEFSEKLSRETDQIFLPLRFYIANTVDDESTASEGELFNYFERKKTQSETYNRLNKMVREGNEFVKSKKTFSYLVMPNGTVLGNDLSLEFTVLIGGKSFFKIRDKENLGLKFKEDETERKAEFLFRGYENREREDLEKGKWYEVGQNGKDLQLLVPPSIFNVGSFLTKRIPTIYIAREMWLKKYSRYLFEGFSNQDLAGKFGVRGWEPMSNKSGDLAKRVTFLDEYTRRLETTNLLVASRFKKKLEQAGEKLFEMSYSRNFFNKALMEYYRSGTRRLEENDTRKLWDKKRAKIWRSLRGKSL